MGERVIATTAESEAVEFVSSVRDEAEPLPFVPPPVHGASDVSPQRQAIGRVTGTLRRAAAHVPFAPQIRRFGRKVFGRMARLARRVRPQVLRVGRGGAYRLVAGHRQFIADRTALAVTQVWVEELTTRVAALEAQLEAMNGALASKPTDAHRPSQA